MLPFKADYTLEPLVVVSHGLTGIIRCYTSIPLLEITSNAGFRALLAAMQDKAAASAIFNVRRTLDDNNKVHFLWNPERSLLTVKTQTDVKLLDEIASIAVYFPKKNAAPEGSLKVFTHDFSPYMESFSQTAGEMVGVLRRLAHAPTPATTPEKKPIRISRRKPEAPAAPAVEPSNEQRNEQQQLLPPPEDSAKCA